MQRGRAGRAAVGSARLREGPIAVAHSLSLAAAMLGWLAVPAPPVEAVIALSIELLRRMLEH